MLESKQVAKVRQLHIEESVRKEFNEETGEGQQSRTRTARIRRRQLNVHLQGPWRMFTIVSIGLQCSLTPTTMHDSQCCFS